MRVRIVVSDLGQEIEVEEQAVDTRRVSEPPYAGLAGVLERASARVLAAARAGS